MKSALNKNLKSCTYYVDGMHCDSCEILVEKKLKSIDGVKSVDASLKNGKVDVKFDNNAPDLKEVNRLFEENGYTFSTNPNNATVEKKPLEFKNGQLLINKHSGSKFLKGVLIAFVVIAGFFLIENSKIGSLVSISSDSSLASFFLFGIIAGFSSCAALVGGLLLSLSKQWSEMYIEKDDELKRSYPFLMFNSGRLISFAVLGGLLGFFGNQFGISLMAKPVVTAIIIALISVYMLLLGLNMLGIHWISKINIKMPKFISSKIADETNFKGKFMPFIVGALTFFLPCGFTLNAQAIALTSGSLLHSGLIMLAFALGTLPVLLLISFTSVRLAQKPKLNALFNIVAGIIVVLFALYNFNAQLNVIGVPSLSDVKLNFPKGNVEYTSEVKDDKQILKTTASASGYSPINATVKAGVPISWQITDDGSTGCTNGIISSQLLGGKQVTLKPGESTTVDLVALEPGYYKYSCWMGMYSGVIRAI